MSFWNNLFKKRAEDWFYCHVPPDQTPNDITIKELQPDVDYLNVFLKKMRVVSVRKGLSKFYGAVHSYCNLYHPSGVNAEFNVVTTASKLMELDAKNIDRVVSMDQRMVGPTAYKGGDFDMEIGLFSIKSADLAKPYLGLLQEASTMAGVSFIGTALPYAGIIKKGVDLITGSQADTILEIGLSKTFATIKTGYYVVMRIDKDKVNQKDIFIDKDSRLVDRNGKAIKDYPYIVIQISGTNEKDDWARIPELQEAYKKLMDDVRKLDFTSSEDSLTVFRRTVLTSNDLNFNDAKRIVKQVQDKVKEILDTTQVAHNTSAELPSLESYNIYA
ncbi:hypothetical protein [uncultured Aquimarina sp.]|uniref:hypothetical protein n=1 Tax=uncultured Aquimarina sp. TaxID=575652 RepID=UPI002603F4AD|nr:hypothetical protein [uncultured Aquimarina sp.]